MPVSIIDILKYYKYPPDAYKTLPVNVLNDLIRRYYTEHSIASK